MSLDRRVYLATAFAAFVAGSAVVLAAPQDPFTVPAALQATEEDVPVVWHESTPPESVAKPPAHGSGLVVIDNGDGGLGVRVPSNWPVDVRREMAVDNVWANVGFVR